MKLFDKKAIIGMVHCRPLPGTAGWDGDVEKLHSQAVQDALTLEKAGVDALIVENMGDGPFAATMDIEQRMALAAVSALVAAAVKIPVGIDAAFNDYEAGLSIALAVGAVFIRVPVFVDTVVTAAGILHPCAHKLMRFRHTIGAEHIKIFADVQVKHSHMLVPSITPLESAVDAAADGADAIIITGAVIGMETPLDLVRQVKEKIKLPAIVGSGFNAKNAKEQFAVADGAIVGSSLKKGGVILNPVDYDLTKALVEAAR